MCQYLFAAFSLKQSTDGGLTSEELEAASRWRHAVAHVATEEMLHLAVVQNVLSAIGAAPHPRRDLAAETSSTSSGVISPMTVTVAEARASASSSGR